MMAKRSTIADSTFDAAIFGHQNALYDAPFVDFFGEEIPARKIGFPPI